MSQYRPELADATGRVYRRGSLAVAGEPLDAGSVQLHFENDLGQLTAQSLRHWVTDVLGDYQPYKGGTNTRGYEGLADVSDPAGSTHNFQGMQLNDISWKVPDFARRYGPFPLLLDQRGDAGPAARNLTVDVYCKAGSTTGSGTTLSLYVQLNASPSPDPEGLLAFASGSASTSADWVSLSLSMVSVVPPPPTTRPIKQIGAAGAPTLLNVSVREAFLFVGWYATDTGDRVYSVSAYEVP